MKSEKQQSDALAWSTWAKVAAVFALMMGTILVLADSGSANPAKPKPPKHKARVAPMKAAAPRPTAKGGGKGNKGTPKAPAKSPTAKGGGKGINSAPKTAAKSPMGKGGGKGINSAPRAAAPSPTAKGGGKGINSTPRTAAMRPTVNGAKNGNKSAGNTSSALNIAILHYAENHKDRIINAFGKTISAGGECGWLVQAALNSAGAKPAHGGNGDKASWGHQVRWVKPNQHSQGPVRPGDILYFWEATWVGNRYQGQHSAIVASSSDGGNLINVWEQGGGTQIHQKVYTMSDLTNGWVKVFRAEK